MAIKLFSGKDENIANETKDRIDHKVKNKNENEEAITMADNKKVTNPDGENGTPAEPAKKEPVAKAKVKKTETEERITGLKNVLRHPIKAYKQNKKGVNRVLAAFGIGVGTGVGVSYGAAKIGETMANRRAAARDRDEDLEIK